MTRRENAAALNQQAVELKESGRPREADRLYRRAAAADPGWSVPWYNLGCNRRATELNPADAAAWWNLGIAATALGRWKVARAAWRGFGIDIPEGRGPIDFPCGFGPIRLESEGSGEVVWAHRIDPARAVLDSIPFPESNHRWGDIVLNDGAPNGYRMYRGKEIPVLDALQLLEPSPFGTYVARVAVLGKPAAVTRLAEEAARQGGNAEDWTTSIRILCKACSEGRPHESHDTAARPTPGVHLIAIAARDRRLAKQILSAWESSTKGVEVQSLEEGIGPGPAS